MISNTRRVFTVAKVAIDEFDCAIDVSEIGSLVEIATGRRKGVHVHGRSWLLALALTSHSTEHDTRYTIKVVGNSRSFHAFRKTGMEFPRFKKNAALNVLTDKAV